MSIADEIAKVRSLVDSGALTEEEFAAQKARILAGGGDYQRGNNATTIVDKRTATKVVALVAVTPLVLLLLVWLIRPETAGPLSYYDLIDMQATFGPNGPNLIFGGLLRFFEPVTAIRHVIVGVMVLVALYFIVKEERKIVRNPFLAGLLSSVAFTLVGFVGLVLAGFWVSPDMVSSVVLTLIFVLIIRSVLGGISSP